MRSKKGGKSQLKDKSETTKKSESKRKVRRRKKVTIVGGLVYNSTTGVYTVPSPEKKKITMTRDTATITIPFGDGICNFDQIKDPLNQGKCYCLQKNSRRKGTSASKKVQNRQDKGQDNSVDEGIEMTFDSP